MNLVIFGSTGASGVALVRLALEQGHSVTAFARRPEALKIVHDRLTILKGDISDAASVDAAIAGKDAVLSTLGIRKLGRNSILSDGTRRMIDAMKKHGVRRFICETSLDVGDSRGQAGFLFTWVFRPVFLRNVFADKEIQEHIIRESGLDWIIVRPAYLTRGVQRGVYRVWVGAKPAGLKNRISRADVADFMLRQLTEFTYVGMAPGLSD